MLWDREDVSHVCLQKFRGVSWTSSTRGKNSLAVHTWFEGDVHMLDSRDVNFRLILAMIIKSTVYDNNDVHDCVIVCDNLSLPLFFFICSTYLLLNVPYCSLPPICTSPRTLIFLFTWCNYLAIDYCNMSTYASAKYYITSWGLQIRIVDNKISSKDQYTYFLIFRAVLYVSTYGRPSSP
jgi:hypothetical protein